MTRRSLILLPFLVAPLLADEYDPKEFGHRYNEWMTKVKEDGGMSSGILNAHEMTLWRQVCDAWKPFKRWVDHQYGI